MKRDDDCLTLILLVWFFLLLMTISSKLGDIRAELIKQTRLQTIAACVNVPLPECKKEGVE